MLVIGLTEFTNSGKRGYTSGASPNFHSDALQTLFFCKDDSLLFIYINFSTGNPNGTSAISFKDERVQDPLLAVKKFSGNCNLGNGRLF